MIINEDWKIESDGIQVILMHKRGKRKEKEDQDIDTPDGYTNLYYSTIESALKSLVEKEVQGTGLDTLKTIVEAIVNISEDIDKALKELKIGFALLERARKPLKEDNPSLQPP